MKVLVIFSNPPGHATLRLDKEDKIITRIWRDFREKVHLERQHASDINDIHKLLTAEDFVVIQFSGHGSPMGLYLEREELEQGELVSAERLVSLLEIGDKPPVAVLMLNCYSEAHLPRLASVAPFVVTTKDQIEDDACLTFVEGFYESFFRNPTVELAFERGRSLMKARGYAPEQVILSRRRPTIDPHSVFIVIKPRLGHDSLLVNLNAVRHQLGSFGMPEEALCHLLEKKLLIHDWIFKIPRDEAIIPIGRLLFGQFSWTNAKDVVYCKKLMKLRADVSPLRWQVWSRLLSSYNDLAGCEYRGCDHPSSLENKDLLIEAVTQFEYYCEKYLDSSRPQLPGLGCEHLLPHLELVVTYVEEATFHLQHGRLNHAVSSLELALTNYHAIVDGVQPPEEST